MSTHEVRQGESVFLLAERYGVTPDELWNANRRLGDQHRKRGILLPGDTLTIPEPPRKTVSCAVEKLHRFVVRQPSATFEVRFCDCGTARAGHRYEREIDGGPIDEGALDDAGWLRLRVPTSAQRLRVALCPPDQGGQSSDAERVRPSQHPDVEWFVFDLHHLDPVIAASGARHRLDAMGYSVDHDEEGFGPATRAAVRLFQRRNGLEATGEVDDATRAKFEEVYGV